MNSSISKLFQHGMLSLDALSRSREEMGIFYISLDDSGNSSIIIITDGCLSIGIFPHASACSFPVDKWRLAFAPQLC